jgi:hypothetical protein
MRRRFQSLWGDEETEWVDLRYQTHCSLKNIYCQWPTVIFLHFLIIITITTTTTTTTTRFVAFPAPEYDVLSGYQPGQMVNEDRNGLRNVSLLTAQPFDPADSPRELHQTTTTTTRLPNCGSRTASGSTNTEVLQGLHWAADNYLADRKISCYRIVILPVTFENDIFQPTREEVNELVTILHNETSWFVQVT